MFYSFALSYLHLFTASTFSFRNSSTLNVSEGEILKVCVEGRDVSTSKEVEIIGTFISNNRSAIGTICYPCI